MWNPPLVNEALGQRASALSEAANLLADLVQHDVRTICFLKSRRGVELIQRFAHAAPGGRRPRRPGRADRALPRRLHARRSGASSSAGWPRASCWRWWPPNALELGIDIGDLDAAICVTFPGHRREPAPDVGARRPPRARARDVRGGRGRARPVLLPPPRRVPRPAGRAGDPRPRVRGDLPRPPRRRRLRAAADAARTRPCSARGWEVAGAAAGERRAACASAAGATSRAAPATRRRRSPCARRRRLGGDRGGLGRRDDRHRRGRRGRTRPSIRARCTCTWARPTRSRTSTSPHGRAVVSPFRGDWYTQAKKESETYIEEIARAARVLRRRAVVRDRVRDRAGGGLPAQARDRPPRARPAGAGAARSRTS